MMIRSMLVALKVLTLLVLSLKVAEGVKYTCYSKAQGRCCFRPNGYDLRLAVADYFHGKSYSTAAKTFGPVIGNWCVDYVHDFSNLLNGVRSFNLPLTNWNTSSALTMAGMFPLAYVFNHPVNFDTSRVTNMDSMLKLHMRSISQ
jgi:hypothetical protein